jgi:hypothetical protein
MINSPDMASINVPLAKRGDIDKDLDRYFADKKQQDRAEAQERAARFREDKAQARALYAKHIAAMQERYAEKMGGRKEVLRVVEQLVKWMPQQALVLFEKFAQETNTKGC